MGEHKDKNMQVGMEQNIYRDFLVTHSVVA